MITSAATESLMDTDVSDCLAVLEAFNLLKPRVVCADELSLENEKVASMLRENNLNLYNWMLKAPDENIIAKELTGGYKASLDGMKLLLDQIANQDINNAIVITYHTLLAEFIDPLIISKHGRDVAEEVRDRAKITLSSRNFEELDIWLLNRDINPGTIADLTVSSIFLALAEGLKF
jgi:triphosphoribosyl-dephospho-CoA synthase